MSDRNKIAHALSVEELDAFVAELASLPGRERTLEAIKRKAAEKGITISLMSAKAFRDTTFDRHLEKIRAAQSIALQVEQIEAGGNTMADAGAKLISKRIFEKLMEAEDEDSASEIDLDEMTLALSRLRQGDVQRAALNAKIREYEAREAQRIAKDKAASEEMQKLRNPQAGLSAEETAAIVAKVDEILGLK